LLGFGLPHDQSVAAGGRTPVEQPQLVPGDVGAVISEVVTDSGTTGAMPTLSTAPDRSIEL
jgi:hypothetical protein